MSRFNPHFAAAQQVFDAAEQFKRRCLLGERSLLLEDQKLWTPEHFQVLIDNYVSQPDVGEGTFYAKLAAQLAACTSLDVALMTEVFWIVQLGPNNFGPAKKLSRLEEIWNMNPAGPFPVNSSFLQNGVLSGLGSGGSGYNQYLWMEIAFAIEAFAQFMAFPEDRRIALLNDAHEFAQWLDSIPSGKGRQFYHVLCHLLFPDDFERIFSQNHKNKVARHFKIWSPDMSDSRPALDAALLELRKRLEAQHSTQIDYYRPPVGTLMKEPKEVAEKPVDATPPAVSQARDSEPADESDESAETTGEALPGLRFADNLILFGPPGTGKTYEMLRLMSAAFDRGEDYEFVAFHPSYSYEDFIGGLRPVAGAGGLGIEFKKGPFLTLCEKAHASPSRKFTLFIDEINRSNVAKVFGELITLIEPSKRVIAGSKPNGRTTWVTLPGLPVKFGVPDNLNVVATMNTADRSIALMDVALRRRFRFVECAPVPSHIDPPNVGAIELPKLLQRINDRIEYLLDRDHVLGHGIFMGLNSLADLQEVIGQRVIPLLQEYFFEDLERVRLVLTGSSQPSVFFSSRNLSPAGLFPGAKQVVSGEPRVSFAVGDPRNWTEEQFLRLYSQNSVVPTMMTPGPDGSQEGLPAEAV